MKNTKGDSIFLPKVTATYAALTDFKARLHIISPDLHDHHLTQARRGPPSPVAFWGLTCIQTYLLSLCFAFIVHLLQIENKTVHWQKNHNSQYCDARFIAVAWNGTLSTSESACTRDQRRLRASFSFKQGVLLEPFTLYLNIF